MKKRIIRNIGIPFIVLAAVTLLLEVVNVDLRVAAAFYDPSQGGWFLGSIDPWTFIYDHANKPALLMALTAVVVLAAGALYRKLVRFRKESLFLIVFLIVGPGLIVNTVFKDHWGRPRPHEITRFGGSQHYHSFWEKGVAARNGSFPSGHASIGFFLIAPYFFLRRRYKVAAFTFLGSGLSAGAIVGAARVVQGGHFLTDVIWAAGMVYLSGAILAELFHFNEETEERAHLLNEETEERAHLLTGERDEATEEKITGGNQQNAENIA